MPQPIHINKTFCPVPASYPESILESLPAHKPLCCVGKADDHQQPLRYLQLSLSLLSPPFGGHLPSKISHIQCPNANNDEHYFAEKRRLR